MSGHIAIVTGGLRGLGKAMALGLLRSGRKVVAVVKPDNTVEIRPVKPAETIGTQWVIDEGLKPGERVVAEGILKVRPGSKVNPQPFAEAPAAAGR